MADFHFHGQRLDNSLVTSISHLLDSVGVPNLLWGNYLLTVYGVPTFVDGVAFVVPDESTDRSYAAISRAGFLPCTQSPECSHWNSPCRLPPTAHLHINDDLAVSLYRKSDVLLDLPEFGRTSCDKEPGNGTMSASDNQLPSGTIGRGQGCLEAQYSSVRIPSALKYCEALIRLLCRDRYNTHRMYWMAMLTYILEYVDGTGILDEKDLREDYRQFYHAAKIADPKMFSILDDLRSHSFA